MVFSFSGSAFFQDEKTLADAILLVEMRAEEDPRFKKYYNECAVDSYAKEQSYLNYFGVGKKLSEKFCKTELEECFSKCSGGNGEACLVVARILQADKNKNISQKYAQTFFAFSCAAGNPGGCTNRAAGIRNGDFLRDPSKEWDEEDKKECTFRFFEKACKKDDAWGCVMLGQAYEKGEGVKRDKGKASVLYKKGCLQAGPSHLSCKYAKNALKNMNGS